MSANTRWLAATRSLRNDPAVGAAVLVLWLLLALFVLYPLAMLLARVFTDQGGFSTAGLAALLSDRHHIRAFGNRLLLALMVGSAGTVLGFMYAFTAVRGRLPRWLLTATDIAVLLPLVSPPFATAIAMIFSFGPRGQIGRAHV